MSHEASEKTRIVVAFGDITGFTAFEQSITNDAVEFDPFFHAFDEIVDQAEKETGFNFQDTGDGYLCSDNLLPGHNCQTVIKFLTALWYIHKRVSHLISIKEPPKPNGFRIRVASGYVHRKIKKTGKIILRGRHINLAHHLLEVSKETGFMVHSTIKQFLSPAQINKEGFIFTKYVPDGKNYEGISAHDLNSLWIFRINMRKDLRRRKIINALQKRLGT